MQEKKIDFWGWVLLISFFIILSFGGYLSYKSIDYKILKKLENTPLVLPSPVPPQTATSSATITSTP